MPEIFGLGETAVSANDRNLKKKKHMDTDVQKAKVCLK